VLKEANVNEIWTNLSNKFWRIKVGTVASLSSFTAAPDDVLQSEIAGHLGEIFFSNKGELVYKWVHYLPIYEKLFSPFLGTSVKLLEIGVFKGGSLKMWREFFGQKASIFGIDIDPKCEAYDGKYGQVRIGSQTDPEFLNRVVGEMGGVDIVLDDGSHVANHQKASFNVLFPLLSEGGLYLIEDLHTAYWPRYGGGLKRNGTAIEFLKAKVDKIHEHYYHPGLNRPETMPDIESIQFFDSIAAIVKRNQFPRHHVQVPTAKD
jgi:cephalosporin hydroxylase